MKTAVSVPDPVFRQAEELAARLAKSRSQLYTEALVAYLTEHDPDTLTERLDEVLRSMGSQEDCFVSETSNRNLSRVEW